MPAPVLERSEATAFAEIWVKADAGLTGSGMLLLLEEKSYSDFSSGAPSTGLLASSAGFGSASG